MARKSFRCNKNSVLERKTVIYGKCTWYVWNNYKLQYLLKNLTLSQEM